MYRNIFTFLVLGIFYLIAKQLPAEKKQKNDELKAKNVKDNKPKLSIAKLPKIESLRCDELMRQLFTPNDGETSYPEEYFIGKKVSSIIEIFDRHKMGKDNLEEYSVHCADASVGPNFSFEIFAPKIKHLGNVKSDMFYRGEFTIKSKNTKNTNADSRKYVLEAKKELIKLNSKEAKKLLSKYDNQNGYYHIEKSCADISSFVSGTDSYTEVQQRDYWNKNYHNRIATWEIEVVDVLPNEISHGYIVFFKCTNSRSITYDFTIDLPSNQERLAFTFSKNGIYKLELLLDENISDFNGFTAKLYDRNIFEKGN